MPQIVTIPWRHHLRHEVLTDQSCAVDTLSRQLEFDVADFIEDPAGDRRAFELLLHDVGDDAFMHASPDRAEEFARGGEPSLVVSIGQCSENGGIEVEAHGYSSGSTQ